MKGMRRAAQYVVFLATAACLLAVVVFDRMPRGTPTALALDFSPQNLAPQKLDKVYADALEQARADSSIVGAGFQLADNDPSDDFSIPNLANLQLEEKDAAASISKPSSLLTIYPPHTTHADEGLEYGSRTPNSPKDKAAASSSKPSSLLTIYPPHTTRADEGLEYGSQTPNSPKDKAAEVGIECMIAAMRNNKELNEAQFAACKAAEQAALAADLASAPEPRDADGAARKAGMMIDAAKALEKAARVEMDSAKAKAQRSSLSAMSDEAKKLAHLNSDSIMQESSSSSKDKAAKATAPSDPAPDKMSTENKLLDALVAAIRAGKSPADIAGSAETKKSSDLAVKIAKVATAADKKQSVAVAGALSGSESREELNAFFDHLSPAHADARKERVAAAGHRVGDAADRVRDVGDVYDKFASPHLTEEQQRVQGQEAAAEKTAAELAEQHAEIKELEGMVLKFGISQAQHTSTTLASAAVRRGRAQMGGEGNAAGVAAAQGNTAAGSLRQAYAGILRAAEMDAMEAKQQGLRGVNLDGWLDHKAEKASENQMPGGPLFSDRTARTANGVPGFMDPDEGGAQLASFSLPAKAPPRACPPCGFLASCEVNPAAVGFSRATGTYNMYPAAEETGTGQAWGGGRAGGDAWTHPSHAATLRQLPSGGLMQSEAPLWTELFEGARSNKVRSNGRRLLGSTAGLRALEAAIEGAEGGSMLASFALPAKAPPKCICPHCKLGDEQIGWGDEHHGMLAIPTNKKVDLIDAELMKLDPAYAAQRENPSDFVYPFANNDNAIFAKGLANPLSDFHEANSAYYNQVATKDKTVW